MSEPVSAEFLLHGSRITAAIEALTVEVKSGFQRLIESQASRQPLDPSSQELLSELLSRTKRTTARLQALAKQESP
jgi:hypothetical protein